MITPYLLGNVSFISLLFHKVQCQRCSTYKGLAQVGEAMRARDSRRMVETRDPHDPRDPQLGAVGGMGAAKKQSITTMVNIRRLWGHSSVFRTKPRIAL